MVHLFFNHSGLMAIAAYVLAAGGTPRRFIGHRFAKIIIFFTWDGIKRGKMNNHPFFFIIFAMSFGQVDASLAEGVGETTAHRCKAEQQQL